MRSAARLVLLAGAVGLGLFLFRAAPREVTLVYEVRDPAARALEVAVERDGRPLRRAELRLPDARPAQVSHRVRLQEGEYVLRIGIRGDGGTRQLERPLRVDESGTVVIPISG